jgi:hypothetical protein
MQVGRDHKQNGGWRRVAPAAGWRRTAPAEAAGWRRARGGIAAGWRLLGGSRWRTEVFFWFAEERHRLSA